MSRHANKVAERLQPGESVIWTGSPCEEKDYGRIDRVLIPISLMLLAICALYALLIVSSVVRGGFRTGHIVEIVILLLVGGLSVYAYFFRFGVKRRIKSDLVYGITNLRRVIIHDHEAGRVHEYSAEQLADAHISEIDRHGVGTIYLGRRRLSNLLDNTGLPFLTAPNSRYAALYDIPHCKKLFALLRAEDAPQEQK